MTRSEIKGDMWVPLKKLKNNNKNNSKEGGG